MKTGAKIHCAPYVELNRKNPGSIAPCILLLGSRSSPDEFRSAALLQLILPIGHDNVVGRDSTCDHANIVLSEAAATSPHVHGVNPISPQRA